MSEQFMSTEKRNPIRGIQLFGVPWKIGSESEAEGWKGGSAEGK